MLRKKHLPIPREQIFLISISVNIIDLPLIDALHSIAEMGGFKINYNENVIPVDKTVSTKMTNKPAIEILSFLLHQNKLDFVFSHGEQLVIIKQLPGNRNRAKLTFTLDGFVADAKTGEILIGTNIFIKNLSNGTASNSYGFYSITLPPGEYTFKYSFVGYATEELEVFLYKDVTRNIELERSPISADTILVTAPIEKFNYKSTEMGTVKLLPDQISDIPTFLGERDILKTLHFLPGIVKGREGDSGFYVRGGSSDQNLILLDEAPIYNAFHTFGFFSVINSDVVKNIKFMKGTAPPKYGGRLSSILDIQMNDGNMKELEGSAGLGMIFSRLTLQGPISKDESSFIISGRRTYIDLFKGFAGDEDVDKSSFYFFDLNAKVNYRFSPYDRLYFSGYVGRDKLGYSDIFEMNWGNTIATARWNHLFSNRLFSNTSLVYSHFNYTTNVFAEDEDDQDVSTESNIQDITFKQDFQYFADVNNIYSFGANYVYHSLLPGEIRVEDPELPRDFILIIGKRDAHELAAYISHEHTANEKLIIDYGFRLNMFSVLGDQDFHNIYDIDQSVHVTFHTADKVNYWELEPRFTATYLLEDASSLKFGYSKNHQYLHMLSDNNSGTPLDVWQPSSSKIKPQASDQISLGYFRSFNENEYEISAEVFYKKIYNLVDFREGANLILKHFFESELVAGEGRAYGFELFFKKAIGNLTGWASYSISRSEKKFPDINDGLPFPTRFDRTHDFSIVVKLGLDNKWNLSANWVYTSGDLISVPYGEYYFNGQKYTAYSARNAYRLPPYHRLDLGISYTNDSGGIWNFSIYNAYARKNTYSVVFKRDLPSQPLKAHQYSLIGILPSISYTMRF
ncbi:TonB-dependent receptor domain-containing protein [Bacteroidota bacterium]